MRRTLIVIAFLFSLSLSAQTGGISSFSFVDVETSPRIEAMGGALIAVVDSDISLGQITPSLLNSSMDKELVFSYTNYFSDINILGFAVAKEIENIGVFSFGLDAIDYGDFESYNAVGENIGSFTAHDQVITLGWGKLLTAKLTVGVNIQVLNSQYERYTALALGANIATTYNNVDKAFTATLLFKNIGEQLISYTTVDEELPFDVQVSISKGLKHLPFRYVITVHHLNQFDIKSPYKLLNQTNIETGELEVKQESFAKTALRHFIIGGELNPFRKSLFIRGGFNFQRRFDMSLATRPALVGFSFGIGFKVSKFRLDYSRASYHLSGTPNNFSIATNLSTFGG